MAEGKIPLRMAKTLLSALGGGVVPRVGLGHITVGRKDEVDALLADISAISDGGASFRFVVGRYGAGKSFLLQAIRNYAMDKNFVVIDADLSPERRLMGTKGEGLATYRELVKNLSTKTAPDGGALELLIQRWVNNLRVEVIEEEGIEQADTYTINRRLNDKIQRVLNSLNTIINGFEYGKVLALYVKGINEDDEELKNKALRWLRGEYTTKTEAKRALGVSVIITDADWYEYIKLLSTFVVRAGYTGMLMLVDEIKQISEIPHGISRQYNYEKMLTIYNDIMQGKAKHLGVIMGATPEAIENDRRGVFSYEALRSRLATSRFAGADTKDLLSPIIRLKTLEPTEIYVLMEKLAMIHGQVYNYTPNIKPPELEFFIKTEYGRAGANKLITPREIIRDFINVLNILMQNPNQTIAKILGADNFDFTDILTEDDVTKDEFKGFEI